MARPKLAILAASLALALPGAGAATSFKQAGFSESVAFSGLVNPTAVRFLPDGRVLVAEKSGRIRMFDSLTDTTATTVADLRTQVHNFWDRGFLGIAVDPAFATNNYIYVSYTRDAFIGEAAPRWGPGDGTSDPCPTPPGPTTDGCVVSGRLSRLTAIGADWTASEHMLIEDWCQQFPSHSVGAIGFGADGYLYLTGGDGASFNNADWGQFGGTLGNPPLIPANPCGDPPFPVGTPQTKPTAEGGGLRSQSPRRTAGEPRVPHGSLLRVDKATGLAAPDNPFVLAGSTDLNERRIIGYGLRNPFRMIVKPGSNDVWIADVGWGSFEELNRVPDLSEVRNFGWPCREGPNSNYTGLNICPTAGETQLPFFFYAHAASGAPGDGCPVGGSAIGGLAFYLGDANYPAAYENALFLSDYTRRCMWVMFPGGGGDPDPATIAPFASSALGPVDLQIGPDGNLYYVDFDGGRVMRVAFGLHAVASANPTSGPVPLTVQFDSTGSTPAEPGDPLSFAWDLDGDGGFDDSTQPQPEYTYTASGTYSARLRVTDTHGGFDVSTPVTIQAGNQAPTATILTPTSLLTWKVGDPIAFSGEANDPQEGDLPPSALSWEVIIHHCPSNCHEHTYQTFAGVASGSFAAPDHEYPSFLEIRLTATDSGSLTSTASVNVNPQTVTLSFASTPSGLQLSSGTLTQPAPFDQTVIANSQITIAAPSPQGAYPAIWEFAAWSDGGAASHTITAAASASYTATFAAHADLSLVMGAAPESICAGLPITYTLDVANAGPSRAVSVAVVDTLPAGASLVSAGGAGWSCNGTAIVTCTRPFLDLGAAPPIQIVASSPVLPGTAVNTATVAAATSDASGADNADQVSTTVVAGVPTPAVAAPEWVPIGATGLAASVESHGGASYAWTLEGGTITGGQGTSAITFDAGAPGTRMELEVTESGASCTSPAALWPVQVDFLDVAPAHPFHAFVIAIARAGVTAGCGGGNYCPDSPVTRGQMAALLLKGKYGALHEPAPATGTVFADVPAVHPFAGWIEELANLGITGGCGGNNYCPEGTVTREQMAALLLKSLFGSLYDPPAASGFFADVPTTHPFARWIEDLYEHGITGGCQAQPPLFCPADPNTRGQMAVFLTLTFDLDD